MTLIDDGLSTNNLIEGCFIQGNSGEAILLHRATGQRVLRNRLESNGCGVVVSNGTGVSIMENASRYNSIDGAFLADVLSVHVEGNLVSSNDRRGIEAWNQLNGSQVLHNVIEWNPVARITLEAGAGNLFWGTTPRYNTAVTGAVGPWDNGYPPGGNDWSTHDNLGEGCGDRLSGASQTEPGPDGICDAPYVGDGFIDRYPLVEPPEAP